jgi:RNA-binding protein Musashi
MMHKTTLIKSDLKILTFLCNFSSVMNNYQAAAAQGYGPPTSPHATNTRTGFPAANSPGPTIDMYSSNGADSVSYVQATSPQPSGFPIAVSRAPLNYSPVSQHFQLLLN